MRTWMVGRRGGVLVAAGRRRTPRVGERGAALARRVQQVVDVVGVGARERQRRRPAATAADARRTLAAAAGCHRTGERQRTAVPGLGRRRCRRRRRRFQARRSGVRVLPVARLVLFLEPRRQQLVVEWQRRTAVGAPARRRPALGAAAAAASLPEAALRRRRVVERPLLVRRVAVLAPRVL